jgi:hypothetical protein
VSTANVFHSGQPITQCHSIPLISLPSDLSPGGSSDGPYTELNIVQGYHKKRTSVHDQGTFTSTFLQIAPSTDVSCTGMRSRHATTISQLSDDIMLEIFDFFPPMDQYDPNWRFLVLPETVWDWHILVHVCQRWRQVVFASPLRLNLRIRCTHGTPVRKDLDIWPTFPIHLEYLPPETIKDIDEGNIIAALEHPDRVSAVGLCRVTGQQLENMVTVMQEPFPALRYIFLVAHWHTSNNFPVLPSEFLGRSAPCLQKIHLEGIPFPALPALLSSTNDLVVLYLRNIPQTGYISPETMVAALTTLTRLTDLSIQFRSPASRPDRNRLPPATRAVLPAVTSFDFCGAHEYLENFVARIDAPLLHDIRIHYLNQLIDFEVPQLWRLIGRSEDLIRPMRCSVKFNPKLKHVTFNATHATNIPETDSLDYSPSYIQVRILCEMVDWQVSHLAQVLNQISVVLPNIIDVVIGSDNLETEDMDDIEWPQLLRQFSSVRALFVSRELAGHISRALEDIAGGMPTEILPALDLLCIQDQPVTSVHKFIASRSESDLPVTTVDTRKAFEETVVSYINQGAQSVT